MCSLLLQNVFLFLFFTIFHTDLLHSWYLSEVLYLLGLFNDLVLAVFSLGSFYSSVLLGEPLS
jgi:hypothetical protein